MWKIKYKNYIFNDKKFKHLKISKINKSYSIACRLSHADTSFK